MSRAQRRAEARAARRAPVVRTARKRVALSFVTGVLMGLALPIALLLTGCGEPYPERMSEDDRYVLCIENGGSWVDDAWGTSCLKAEGSEK